MIWNEKPEFEKRFQVLQNRKVPEDGRKAYFWEFVEAVSENLHRFYTV